jgi:2-iminobutanoate/2-iminopropanoate deaminase
VSEFRVSHGIVADGRLQVSGQVGMDSERIVGDDVETQTRQGFDNLKTVLTAAGCTLDDGTSATAYIVGPQRRFEAFHSVWDERVTAPYPCLTVVGVAELNVEGLLVEIEAEAVVPD